MDRAKLLKKIEKCLNLSKSSEPHEAAAAMRQAKKMMEAHGVSEAELGAVGFGNEKVAVPIQANQKLPIALAQLVNIIKVAFGVAPVIETEVRVTDASYVVRYWGPMDRALLASYSHTVVFRAMNRAWAEHLKANPQLRGRLGARAGFQLGWLAAIREQVEELAMTDSERAGTDIAKANHYGKALVKGQANNMRISNAALNAGTEAGRDFRLHRPVQQERLKLTN